MSKAINPEYIRITFKRMEWLSSESRQIILARFALRSLHLLEGLENRSEIHPESIDVSTHNLLRVSFKILAASIRNVPSGMVSPISPKLDPFKVSIGYPRGTPAFVLEQDEDLISFGFALYGYKIRLGSQSLARTNAPIVTTDELLESLRNEVDSIYNKLRLDDRSIASIAARELAQTTLWSTRHHKQTVSPSELLVRLYGSPRSHLESNFWAEVFDGLLGKVDLDWKFFVKIADLDGWNVGPPEVSKQLDLLRADHFAEQTTLAESVFYNDETARVGRTFIPQARPKSMATMLEALRDALDDATAGNALTVGSYDYKTLDRTMTKYHDNPERVEMDVAKIWGSLQWQMNEKYLPDAPELMGLCKTLDEVKNEIHANHPDIKAARAKRMLEALRGATNEEKEAMLAGLPVIREVVEPEFAEEIIDDLGEIIEGTSVTADGNAALSTDAVSRSGNRLAKIWLAATAAVAGTGIAASTIVNVEQALPTLHRLWQIMAKLLGIG